jgi:beta-lactamase class A
MKSILFTSTLLLITTASACSGRGVTQPSNPIPSPTQSAPAKDKQPDAELAKQLKQIAAAAKGKVGVAALVLETGENVSLNSQDHFPMQSVYKLPIGMATMAQVDAGRIKLDQKVHVGKEDFIGGSSHSPIRDKNPNGVDLSVRELLGWMLLESDGTASDVLMKLAGGPAAIQAYLSKLGLKDMIVLDPEKAFAQDHSLQYRNWATPAAAIALLTALQEHRELSQASQSLLLKLMSESVTGPRRLKRLLPAGTYVAHKTGTSGTDNGVTAATNDIGIITLPDGRHVVIAVFVSDSPADETTREGVIARTAKAVWDKWGR